MTELPSSADLRAMLAGSMKGVWLCWGYVNLRRGTHICAWNRDMDLPPLRDDPNLLCVGFVAFNYDKLP